MAEVDRIRVAETDSDGAGAGPSKPAVKRQVKKKITVSEKDSEEEQESSNPQSEQTVTNQLLKELMTEMKDIRSQMRRIEVKVAENVAPKNFAPEREEIIQSQPDQLNDGFKSIAAEIKKLTDNRTEDMFNIRKKIPKFLNQSDNHPVKMSTEQLDEMLNLKRRTSDLEGHLRVTIDTYQRVMANIRKAVVDANPNLKEQEYVHSPASWSVPVKAAFADVVIGRMISRQFDAVTENDFSFYQAYNNIDNRILPSLSMIENFVHRRIHDETSSIRTVQKSQGYSQPKIHVQQVNTKCLYCNKKGHGIDECRKFTNLTIDDRVKAARSVRLCFKCAIAKWSDCNCKNNKNLPYHKLLQFQQERDTYVKQKRLRQ